MTHDILNKIRNYLKQIPVEKAWIFGSMARGEDTSESDVDILVQFIPKAQIDLFDHVTYQQTLEDLLGRAVDLVVDGTLFPWVLPEVEKDKILIYEREIA